MWEITKDYINVTDLRVGHKEQHSRIHNIDRMLGFESEELPSRYGHQKDFTISRISEELPKIKFRTIDDDGNKCYAGWLHDDDECANQEAALKFAETDVGATSIVVKRDDGKGWVQEIA